MNQALTNPVGHPRRCSALAAALAVIAASQVVPAASTAVEPEVLAAERHRVEVIQRGSAAAVAIFAGDSGGG